MTDAAQQQPKKHKETFLELFSYGLLVTRRLFLPVIGLVLAFAVALDTTSQRITLFDGFFPPEPWYLQPGYWLTTGHFMVPVIFFVSMLTNRAYGAGYALAQMVAAWTVVIMLIAFLYPAIESGMPIPPLPTGRVFTAFLIALFGAQIINIVIFDQVRGRPWWRAPLYSALFAGFTFCLLYYPIAKAGLDPWAHQMTVNIAVTSFMAFLMLVPYALLRPWIRPLPGFGGA